MFGFVTVYTAHILSSSFLFWHKMLNQPETSFGSLVSKLNQRAFLKSDPIPTSTSLICRYRYQSKMYTIIIIMINVINIFVEPWFNVHMFL